MKVKNFYFNQGDIELSVFVDKHSAFQSIMYDEKIVFFVVNEQNKTVTHITSDAVTTMNYIDTWKTYPEAFKVKSLYVSKKYPKDISFMFKNNKRAVCVSVHNINGEHFICLSNKEYLEKINNKG